MSGFSYITTEQVTFHEMIMLSLWCLALAISQQNKLQCDEVLASLKNAKSGIKFDEKYAELGLRSQVSGQVAEVDSSEIIDTYI